MTHIKNIHKTTANIFKSWLRATKIPYENKDLTDFSIKTPSGKKFDVTSNPEGIGFFIDYNKIKNENYRAFWEITELLGYGSPVPVDRGGYLEKGRKNKNDEFSAAIRHRESQYSPNFTQKQYQEYIPVIKKAVNIFFVRNKWICESVGYEKEDIEQVCLMLLVNFCSRYEQESISLSDNQRNLMSYLKQRLAGLKNRMIKRIDHNRIVKSELGAEADYSAEII